MDSLLALGVSLTNEIEHTRALRHLRTWLENHDEYAHLVKGAAPEDFRLLGEDVVHLFEAASVRRWRLHSTYMVTACPEASGHTLCP